MRRLLVVLLVVATATFVVRGGVPCEVVELQPGCYVALKPGPTEDAAALVDIGGAASYSSSGELRLTTVAVEEDLDLAAWARAVLSSTTDTAPRTVLFPPGADRDEVTRQNAALMADSQLAATVAALRHTGYEVPEGTAGARVHDVLTDTADEVLEVGDVILSVDGRRTTDSAQVAEAVSAARPGQQVQLEVRREGERLELTAMLGAAPDDPRRPFLGVLLVSALDLPFDIAIDAGVIGGPSAGLMFALSIVDLLEPEDLTGGLVVAGSGTVDADGAVGAVGGLRQKVVGATDPEDGRRPASVFLVPADGLDQVRGAAVARELEVVPVATLGDALGALEDLRAGRRPEGSFALSAGD